jgi:hypothetical protein
MEIEKLEFRGDYGLGQIWEVDYSPCILAQVERRKIALIGLTSGNRQCDPPVVVKNVSSITKEEFHRACRNAGIVSFLGRMMNQAGVTL